MIVKVAITKLFLSLTLPGRHGPEVILLDSRFIIRPAIPYRKVRSFSMSKSSSLSKFASNWWRGVTLSSSPGTGEEAMITVQKQRSYVDKKPVVYDIIHSR